MDNHTAGNFHELNHSIDANLNIDKDWEDFRLYFEKSYPDFFSRLESRFTQLTENDKRLCAYFLIKLPINAVADALHITPDSVKKSRTRLRKKLGLDPKDDLAAFLNNL